MSADIQSKADKAPKPSREAPPIRLLAAKWDDRSTFSVPEVCEILGVSSWCGWEAVKSGEIGTIRVGRRRLVPRHVIERILASV